MKKAWAIGGLVCLIAGHAMAQAGEPAPPENRYSAVQAQRQAEREHIHQGRISFAGGGQDVYASNIQVADLNALNACLAVIKWKKLRGFYRDLEQEHHSTYTTDGGMLLNGDQL